VNQGFDAVAYKESTRAEWRAAAAGWLSWFDVLEAAEAGSAVTKKLIELAALGPGDEVLDVAAGYGEPGLTAARAVGPNGRVVCTDISSEMLAVGQERAVREGITNVDFIEADAEELHFDDGTFDAVLSRQGLQFLPDVGATLLRLRSFLKPNGRLAAAVWGPPESVQFAAAVPIIRRALELPPPPQGPGPFALSDTRVLALLVESAGFKHVETGSVTAVYETESPERTTQWLRDVAPPLVGLVKDQPPAVQERVWHEVTQAWAPFITPEGHVRTENQAIWVTATK
jgi:enediyne biosynthesis protein CalE5